jgi:hypothetical protein
MKKAAGRDILSLEATNGKISIHLGDYTQLMFGIKGNVG